MHPILFHIGTYPVRAYSLAVMGGLLAAAYFAVWLGRRRGLPWAERYGDFWPYAFFGGLIGARLWEVAFLWEYYRTAPLQVLALWEGGLSIQGGVLGGLLACWLYTRAHGISFGRFLDGLAPSLLLGQAIGRLFGCTLNGCAFGKPTGTNFGIVHAAGTNAYAVFGSQPLWPAELFEGLFDLVLMGVLLRLGVNRGPAGAHFVLYAFLYSTGRFALEFLRADTAPVWRDLTAAQVGSMAVIALCTVWLAWQMWARMGRPPVVPGSPGK